MGADDYYTQIIILIKKVLNWWIPHYCWYRLSSIKLIQRQHIFFDGYSSLILLNDFNIINNYRSCTIEFERFFVNVIFKIVSVSINNWQSKNNFEKMPASQSDTSINRAMQKIIFLTQLFILDFKIHFSSYHYLVPRYCCELE